LTGSLLKLDETKQNKEPQLKGIEESPREWQQPGV
jgi:hypothetical protein